MIEVRLTGAQIDRGIVDAAARTFAVHGYAKTSVQQLADAVGYSKTGLLHRFSSKQALHDAVIVAATEAIDEILDGTPDVPEGAARVRTLLDRVAAQAIDRPGLAHLLVEAIRPESEEPGRMQLHERVLRLAAALDGGAGTPETASPTVDDAERRLRVALALRLVVDAVLAQDNPLLQVDRSRIQPLVVDLAVAVLGPADPTS